MLTVVLVPRHFGWVCVLIACWPLLIGVVLEGYFIEGFLTERPIRFSFATGMMAGGNRALDIFGS